MDFVPQLPRDSDQLKQTLAKAHRNCQEMEWLFSTLCDNFCL